MANYVTNDTIPGHARVRTLVLAAVHDELVHNGYRGMTLQSIAARAGMPEEAVEAVFVSKESVLVAHLDRMNAALVALLGSIARTDAPLRDRLRELLIARVVFRFDMLRPYAAHLEEMREVLVLAMRHRGPLWAEAEARILERLLAQGQRGGMVDAIDPSALARTLLTATNGLLPSEATLTPLPGSAELRRLTGEMVDVVLDGSLLINWPIAQRESHGIRASAI